MKGRWGEHSNAGSRNRTKKATPPRKGVGRRCHRSLLGSETQPQRMARKRIAGIINRVSPKAEPSGSQSGQALNMRLSPEIFNHAVKDFSDAARRTKI